MPPHGKVTISELTDRARATAAAETERRAALWAMTPQQRLDAFYSGQLSVRDCLEWASRYPNEPPLSGDGEFLFITARTPEWLDDDDAPPSRSPSHGREL